MKTLAKSIRNLKVNIQRSIKEFNKKDKSVQPSTEITEGLNVGYNPRN